MTVNAGDLMELTQDNLPASSILVFIVGFVSEEVQDDNTFKNIKIITTEFIAYTALSRYSSWDNVQIVALDRATFKTDPDVVKEYERLELVAASPLPI
jgi:hypothetical protein